MADLLIQFLILVLSLAAMITFSEKLIDSSAKLAHAFGISDVVIGLTLLAYGTSLPELTVSSISSIGSHPEISVSNIIGSNIANIALIIGLAAFIRPFSIKGTNLAETDILVMIVSTVALVLLFFISGGISKIFGALMILSVVTYTYYTLKNDRTVNKSRKDRSISKLKETGIVLTGLLIVVVSGKFAVNSAIVIAEELEVTEWMIGATIVAFGTSLPELAVSITAAKKGFFGMSIGNIVGSNIFNILWVLGFAASLNSLTLDFNMITIDSIFLLVVTLLFAYHLNGSKVSRSSGIIYISIYSGYIYYLLTF